MTRIQKLFLLLTIIGPLHMGEQLVTRIDEFYAIRRFFAGYYAWFPAAAADHASVILITIFWTVSSVMLYAVLLEGTPRLVVMALMGIFGVTELHHLIETFTSGAYDPGVVTCIPYAAAGWLMVQATWREFQRGRSAVAGAATLVPAAR